MRAKARAFAGLSLSQACHASVSSIDTSVLCRRTSQSAAARCVGRDQSPVMACRDQSLRSRSMILAAVKQSTYDVFAHHAVGDAEPGCDGGGIQSLDLVHDKRLAALCRHGLDQNSQVPQRLFTRQLPFRRATLRQFRKELMTGNPVEILMSPAPIDRYVGRCLEEKRAQIADSPRLIETQKPYVGFLGDFARLVVGSDPPPQEANQGLVVFTKQPLDDLRPRYLLIGRGSATWSVSTATCLRDSPWRFVMHSQSNLDERDAENGNPLALAFSSDAHRTENQPPRG